MQLTERHIIKSTEHRFAQIDSLAFKSKNLYNAANYVIRQSFIYGWNYVNYNEMNRFMKSHEAYKALPAFGQSANLDGARQELEIVF